MADPALIFNEGAVASPNAYVIPPGLAFKPTSVTAHFDGTGAGSDFLACLTFYSQDGKLIGRSFPEAAIADGDAVEASFRPF